MEEELIKIVDKITDLETKIDSIKITGLETKVDKITDLETKIDSILSKFKEEKEDEIKNERYFY